MGNQLAQPQKLQPEHLAELNDVTLQDMLGAHFQDSHGKGSRNLLHVCRSGRLRHVGPW